MQRTKSNCQGVFLTAVAIGILYFGGYAGMLYGFRERPASGGPLGNFFLVLDSPWKARVYDLYRPLIDQHVRLTGAVIGSRPRPYS